MDKKEYILQTNDMQFTCIAHLECIPQFHNVDGFNTYGFLIIKTLDTPQDEIKDYPCKFCEEL